MKSLFVYITVFIVVLSCNNHNKSSSTMEAIQDSLIVSTPKHYNLGVLKKDVSDSIYTFKFEITNMKTDSIHINNVDVSCGCLFINSFPRKIAPGETNKLVGTINISQQRGHLSKAIFVNYDEDGLLILRIIGDIKS